MKLKEIQVKYGILTCPICKNILSGDEKTCRCENGHSFDLAKQGYINLFISSKQSCHGDNKQMTEARRNFLSEGHYSPLCRALCEKVCEYANQGNVLIDCGCGECYYTDSIDNALKEKNKSVTFYGFDISRDAILAGARRNKALNLIVAGVYHMPFADSSADMLFSVFSPFAEEEFLRVLKKGGLLFSVIPKENHLWSLKKAIYDTPYKNEVADYNISGFSLIESKEIKNKITLSGESLQNLFMMTPYYYRTSEKDKKKFSALSSLEVETEFEILIYKKL